MAQSYQDTSSASFHFQEFPVQESLEQRPSQRIDPSAAIEKVWQAMAKFDVYRKKGLSPEVELDARLEVIHLLVEALEVPQSTVKMNALRGRLAMYCSYAVTQLQHSDDPEQMSDAVCYQKLALEHSEIACNVAQRSGNTYDYLCNLSDAAYGYRNLSIILKKMGNDVERLEPAEKAVTYFKYLVEVSEERGNKGFSDIKRLNHAHLLRNCATQMLCLAEDYSDLSVSLTRSFSTSSIALFTRALEHAADAIQMFDKLIAETSRENDKSRFESDRKNAIHLVSRLNKKLQRA